MSWAGTIPCTGRYRCAMCGLSVQDIAEQEGIEGLTPYARLILDSFK